MRSPGYDQEKTQGVESFDPRRERDEIRGGGFAAEAKCTEAARPISRAEILHEIFSYHPPTPNTLPKFDAINQAAKNFAEVILQNCSGDDCRVALNCIRNARMFANASIALDGLSL
jgi:hypothetical protein